MILPPNYPRFNSFIKGRRLVILDNLTISVLIERDILGEKVPEPVGIQNAQAKSYLEIDAEIKSAKKQQNEKLGGLSGQTWFQLIPGFLLKLVIRIADKNTLMAKKYGKVAVTAIGMFSKEPVWFIPHGCVTATLVRPMRFFCLLVKSKKCFPSKDRKHFYKQSGIS